MRDNPGVPEFTVNLGGAYCNLGTLFREGGENESALPWYRKAIAVLEPVSQGEEPSIQVRLYLRQSIWPGTGAMKLDRFAEAIPNWDLAIELEQGR